MQDPKFEDDVRRKMEELVVSPSDSVWLNVDKAINPKTRRRVPFFWWISAGGLLILGIFLVVNYRLQNPSPQSASVTSRVKISPVDSVANKTSRGKSESQEAELIPEKNIFDNPKNHVSTVHVKTSELHLRTFGHSTESFDGVAQRERHDARKAVSGFNNLDKNLTPDKSNNTIDKRINENEKDLSLAPDTPAPVTGDLAVNKPTTNKVVRPTDSAKTLDNKANKTPIKIKTSHNCTLGFNLSGGVSGVNKTLFESVSNAPQNNNVFYPSANPHYSSTTKPSASFGGGFFLEKKIAPRWKLRAEINYHYYSTQIETGRGVDSAALIVGRSGPVSSFYRDGSDHPYINRYHFLEVPIELGFLISKSKNWPICLNTGLAASFLLHTNALHFDPFGAIYYQDKDYFNKTQFYATTDLGIGLPIKGIHLQVGPQVQYGFTNLLNHLGTARQHLVSGGLKLSINLSKN